MTRFGTIMKTATARWHDGTLARKAGDLHGNMQYLACF